MIHMLKYVFVYWINFRKAAHDLKRESKKLIIFQLSKFNARQHLLTCCALMRLECESTEDEHRKRFVANKHKNLFNNYTIPLRRFSFCFFLHSDRGIVVDHTRCKVFCWLRCLKISRERKVLCNLEFLALLLTWNLHYVRYSDFFVITRRKW